MSEHTILVAFTVEADNRHEAHTALVFDLSQTSLVNETTTSWWVAEDDRTDGSDNDSAVFVHPGAQQVAVTHLYQQDLSDECNLSQGSRVINQFKEGT